MKRLLTASIAVALISLAGAQSKPPLTDSQKAEVAQLKAKAAKLTKQVGKIASTANLQESDDAVKLLKDIAEELASIRDRLRAIEDARGADKQEVDQVAKDVDRLKRTTFNGYIQFQYFNSNQTGASQPNAFLIRRARLGLVETIDPRATLRLSAEFADDSNRMDTRLKDAILDYNLAPDLKIPSKVWFGQYPIPIGYDLERSDADREVPERSVYNQTLFKNERSRGVVVKANPDKHLAVGLGAMDSLTVDDPEQTGLAPGQGNKISAVGYVRFVGPGYRLGLSGIDGKRPEFTASSITSPEINRELGFADIELHPSILPHLTIRGEGMVGHDRVPSATAAVNKTGKPMGGFQAQATYDISAKHQLNFRWQGFDPDLSTGGNAITGLSFSYQFFPSPGTRLMLAQELFTDQSRAQKNYYQTTLRVQFKF